MKPKISVVMSVFNENFHELKESINSILNQKYPNFELIIVDDNPSSLYIKRSLYKLTRYSDNVKILFNKINLGAALSRDKGEKQASGKFLAIMDADDVANKYRLADQLSFLLSNKLDFVFPNYNIISTSDNILRSKMYNITSIINQNKLHYIFSHIKDIAINSGWFMYKRVFDKLNGYNNIVVEDYDLLARAIIFGYKLGFQSRLLMSVRFRKNSIMRQNALSIFLETKCIRYSLIRNSYEKTPTNIYDKKTNDKFNNFIVVGHNLKYNFTLFNIIKFLYSLVVTKFAFIYVISKFISKIKERKYLQ